jgi:hypothetical protein
MADPFAPREDVTSLIRTENLTSEAVRKAIVPPAPLLKGISFAPIDGDGPSDDDEANSESDHENDAQDGSGDNAPTGE